MRILILVSIIAWSTFACANDQIQPCPKDLQAKADQAYLEYFPLLENARAYQAAGMGLAWGKAHPTNTINHNTQLLDHTFDTVVGPNNDTLYSSWTLDLSAGPVYIEMPYIDPAKRYSSILILDSMHYEVGVTVNPSGKIMFVRSGTKYTVPKDVSEVYKFNSDLNVMLHRTEVIDNNDLDDVIALQKQMKTTAPVHRNMDEIYPALDADFVTRANSLLSGTTLSKANAKNAECYKEIGILSDKKIDRSILDKAVENGQAWMKANESKFDTAYFNNEENAPKKNHQTGRALANYVWHLAFQPKHADYPNIEFDTDGKRLHGDNVYTLTFDKDLPVNAFWSMTTYILKTKHFVPNDEKLYKVGDKTAVLNPDGETITITYSATRPENVTNWQPTPKGKEFYIGVRLYEAKKEWLDGKYKLPVPVISVGAMASEPTLAELHAYKVHHHADYLKVTAAAAGGTNTLIHTTTLPTEGTDPVVTPALDHLYSKAVIDLSNGPVVLELPEVKNRYFSIMITDQEHYVTYDEIRPVGRYVFVRHDWKGEAPEGKVLKSRGDYPHLFIRTQVFDNADLPNSIAIQDQIKLMGKQGEIKFDNSIKFTLKTHDVYPQNDGILASITDYSMVTHDQR